MNRRELLRWMGRSVLALPLANMAVINNAFATDPITSLGDTQNPNFDDTILVLIKLNGGNDALNTLVPFTDPTYYHYRRDGRAFDLSIAPEKVLKLPDSDTVGFHPALKPLLELYTEGKVCCIQNVGYPNPNTSHFRSTDIILSASDADVYDTTGWVGRYLQYRHTNASRTMNNGPFAVELGITATRLTNGSRFEDAFIYSSPFNSLGKSVKKKKGLLPTDIEQEYIQKTLDNSNSYLDLFSKVEKSASNSSVEYPTSYVGLSEALSRIAKLIAGGIGSRLYSIDTGMLFDNHENLIRLHNMALDNVINPIYAFQRDIEKRGVAKKVVMVLYSEFGRRVTINKDGLDHGAAGLMILIGNEVNGGIIGTNPDLRNLDENENLRHKIDFRSVYSSLLEQWYGEPVHLLSPVVIPHRLPTLNLIKGYTSTSTSSTSYPNPASTDVYIDCISKLVSDVNIYDANGKSVYCPISYMYSRAIQLDCTVLPIGNYYVTLTENGTQKTSSFVVYR